MLVAGFVDFVGRNDELSERHGTGSARAVAGNADHAAMVRQTERAEAEEQGIQSSRKAGAVVSVEHYWPDELGVHDIEHKNGDVETWSQYSSKCWRSPDGDEVLSETGLIEHGYLGVRREQPADDAAQLKADFDNAKEDAWDWMLVANERAAEIENLRAEVKRLEAAVNTWVEIAINRRDESKSLSRMIDERDALLREAIAEFRRDVKQPTKAADWAFRWANRFIEAVEQ